MDQLCRPQTQRLHNCANVQLTKFLTLAPKSLFWRLLQVGKLAVSSEHIMHVKVIRDHAMHNSKTAVQEHDNIFNVQRQCTCCCRITNYGTIFTDDMPDRKPSVVRLWRQMSIRNSRHPPWSEATSHTELEHCFDESQRQECKNEQKSVDTLKEAVRDKLCKNNKQNAFLSPPTLLFIHKFWYFWCLKFSTSLFFYLFNVALNLWHRKFVTVDVTAVCVNNQHVIQRREQDYDKTHKYTQNTQFQV